MDLDEPFESSLVPRALALMMGEEEEPGEYGGEGGGKGDLQGTFL